MKTMPFLPVVLVITSLAALAGAQTAAPPAEPGAVYLSDLPEEKPVVGFGAFGKNGQMGFQSLRIVVNGKPSPKGLSTHAKAKGQASVGYFLGGQYATFKTEVAVNDNAVGKFKSSLTFIIKGDGKELWRSTEVTKAAVTQAAEISVAGVQKLELIVDCPGAYDYAQAVWIEPRLFKTGAAPSVAMPASPATAASPAPAPPAITDPRLAQLDTAFKAKLAADVQQPHDAIVTALNEKYYAALARAREAAKQKGDFAEVTALDDEKKRIETKQGVPPADVEGTPAALATLRATYRTTVAKFAGDRDARAVPLYDAYLRALDAHIVELTKADKIAAAKDAQAFRDRVALDKPVPAAPPAAVAATEPAATPPPGAPMKNDEPVKIATSSPWREVATWALSMDAELVQIRTLDGGMRDVRSAADLPAGKFEVLRLKFEKRAKELTDDGFTRIALAKDLRSLEIPWQEKGVPITSLKPLRGLKKLEALTLTGLQNLDGAEFASLAECTALQTLIVGNTGLNDASISALRPLTQLTHFSSTGSKGLTDAGLRALLQFRNLKSLHFGYGHGFGDAGITALAELPNLEALTLFRLGSPGNAFTGGTLGGLRKLTMLSIEGPLAPDGLRAIGQLAALQELTLINCGLNDDAVFTSFATLSKLTVLYLAGANVTGEGLVSLGAARGMKSLSVEGASRVTAAGLAAIAKTFPALEGLSLEAGINSEACAAADLSALSALTNLKGLSISLRDMDDAWIAECAKLGALEGLKLGRGLTGNTKMTNAGLKSLAALKRLQSLELYNAPGITDDAVPALKQIKSLRRLGALRCGLTNKGIDAVNAR